MKFKILDIHSEIEEYDPTLPKHVQFDIEKFYKKTGLPRIPKSREATIDEREKLVFMATNILRVYK